MLSFYSSKTPLSRVLILTTQKYNNFNEESLIEDILKHDSNNGNYILNENGDKIILNKNEVANVKMYEFYIRNAEPESGVLTKDTKITIENKDIHNISRLKLAIIKVNRKG